VQRYHQISSQSDYPLCVIYYDIYDNVLYTVYSNECPMRTWRLEAANVVRTKSIQRLNDRHWNDVFNEITWSLSPEQPWLPAQRRWSANVCKHRHWTTGGWRRATVDVWRDEVQLETPSSSPLSSSSSSISFNQSINQSAWTCYGAPHSKLWGARNTVKIQQHNSVTIVIQRRGESLV